MSGQTNELAFETHVETMLILVGWRTDTNVAWKVDSGLFPSRSLAENAKLVSRNMTEAGFQ